MAAPRCKRTRLTKRDCSKVNVTLDHRRKKNAVEKAKKRGVTAKAQCEEDVPT